MDLTRWLRWETGLTALAVAMFIVMARLSPDFATTFTLQSLALNAAVIGFLAIGVAPVIMGGDIDISIAAMTALCGVISAVLWTHGVNIWVASVVGLMVGAVLGLVNGLSVVLLDLPPLAVTLGTMGAYTGVGFLILGGSAISNFPASLVNLGSGFIGVTPIPISSVVLIGVTALLAILMHRTTFGRTVFAVGSNRQASRFSGLAVVRTRIMAFVICGVLAAVASIFYLGYFNTAQAGSASEDLLPAITVVLLGGVSAYGGTGTILGVFVALVVVSVLESGLGVMGLSGQELSIAVGILLIVAVASSVGGRWLRGREGSGPELAPPPAGPGPAESSPQR